MAGFERVSELQDEILGFTFEQVGDKVDKFYVEGKVTSDRGQITMSQGVLAFAVKDNQLLENLEVLSREELRENNDFVIPRVRELFYVLVGLQGRAPSRFRWSVDTRTGEVEGDWTYYEDFTEQEKEDDFWEHWEGDDLWRDQLKAELAAGEGSRSTGGVWRQRWSRLAGFLLGRAR